MSTGIVNGNKQNTPGGSVPRTRSTFPMSYVFKDTHRFGEYHPFFVMDVVDNDKIQSRCQHDVRSFTLKAPLMDDIKLKKDYFQVPRQALYPLNWDKFIVNPTIGDDVPDMVQGNVNNFWNIVGTRFSNLFTSLKTGIASASSLPVVIQSLIKFMVLHEYIYSEGSLLTSLGIHGNAFLSVSDSDNSVFNRSIDYFVDDICTEFLSQCDIFVSDQRPNQSYTPHRYVYLGRQDTDYPLGSIYSYSPGGSAAAVNYSVCSLHQIIEIFRDDLTFIVDAAFARTSSAGDFISQISSHLSAYTFNYVIPTQASATEEGVPCDLSRVFAYQMVCAHFYTNDHVDFIYSADLFRQLVTSLLSTVFGTQFPFSFTYNGVSTFYDVLSGYCASQILNLSLTFARLSDTSVFGSLPWYSTIFAFRRSLRFLDYFTGSRTRPLAVGDVNVDVNSSKVNIIDVSRNIQKQRFLNMVNRTGRKIGNYFDELMGKAPAHDWHDPLYLGHTADVVFGSEVENTGDAQQNQANSVTSVLRSNASRFAFQFDSDRDSIILGICYYDISRSYSRSIERPVFWKNRFDFFNPFMQFIGDQPIYRQELNLYPVNGSLSNFAYTGRHMEFKQRFNQAAGGFISSLPGWTFIADDSLNGTENNLSPDFIRSYPSELDKFYVSLTGYSLATYFHFIVKSTNEVQASRPMAYNPSIL